VDIEDSVTKLDEVQDICALQQSGQALVVFSEILSIHPGRSYEEGFQCIGSTLPLKVFPC
jgi:hypothetical protein